MTPTVPAARPWSVYARADDRELPAAELARLAPDDDAWSPLRGERRVEQLHELLALVERRHDAASRRSASCELGLPEEPAPGPR